jgi:[acyl-carrier-protein] S-malonyltransferase
MGQPWRDHTSWSVVEQAEKALGAPLAPLLLEAVPDRTREAQLAVLCTSLVAWDAVRGALAADDIAAFAGHSLGQVTALIAAGVLGFDDGVRFAASRADATQAAADASPGRMAALLGATVEQADAVCTSAGDGCWVANDNAPGQVVIAGTPDGIDRAVANAREHGVKRATVLKVGGAFHTPLMGTASDAIRASLVDVVLGTPIASIVSNEDALAYSDGDGWRERLARHVIKPVRFRDSLETIGKLDVTHLIEVGHGGMIAGLAKRTIPDVEVIGIATPDDLGRLQT